MILIISAVFPPEPVVSASISKALAEYLASKKNFVTVLCPQSSRPKGYCFTEESQPYHYKIQRLKSFTFPDSNIIGRIYESYSFGKSCAKYISDNANIIEIIYVNTWPMLAQYYTVKEAHKNNIPIILHIQDIYPETLSAKFPVLKPIIQLVLEPFDKFILNLANIIVAISEKMRSHLIKSRNIEQAKVVVIPNWQDENEFVGYNKMSQNLLKNDSPFTFMYLGNIGPIAGLDKVIDAYIKSELKDTKLVIAGAGSRLAKLKQKVSQYTNASIEFWPVNAGKVPEIQNKANVMILPLNKGASLSSIPSKLPAYMFSSKPILASVDHDSDTADAIRESECGWIVSPDSVDQLSLKMRQIYETPKEVIDQKGRNGYEYAMKFFSKQINVTRLAEIVETSLK